MFLSELEEQQKIISLTEGLQIGKKYIKIVLH